MIVDKPNLLIFDLLCAQPVGNIKFHGGGEYTKTVFKFLVENRDVENHLEVFYNEKNFIDDWIIELIERKGIAFKSVSSSQEILNEALKLRGQYNITIFCGLPYGYRNFEIPDDIKFVGVLHGLRDIEKLYDKKMFVYDKGLTLIKDFAKILLSGVLKKKFVTDAENIIRVCDVLIVDSNHTKYSLKVNVPSCSTKEPYVFYPLTQLNSTLKNEEIQSNGYLMIISANRWLKNSYRAILAIDSLYSKGLIKNIKTHVFGNLPNRIKCKIKNKEQFVFFNYVTAEELEQAYKSCEILLYPTLNEGFGNVPMEAMKYGKTCVVSAVCSLTEVYQDTVYYCNPYDIMEIQNRILQAIDTKIDTHKIENRLNVLNKKQIDDMNHLCDLLLN